LLKQIRNRIKQRKEQGLSWHGVIDSLRPYNQLIWSNFTLNEKRSFLRHLRPYWDVHRHRMSSEIFGLLQKEIESRKTILLSGRIVNLYPKENKLQAEIKLRSSSHITIHEFDFAVDATGMQIIKHNNIDSFYDNLLKNNLASLDQLKIGIRVNLNNQLLDSSNNIVNNIYGLGPVALGSLWETIAVPEISKMAFALKNTLDTN
jgi:uncharacterized NAD(P)/FAD-binding protein YdhS